MSDHTTVSASTVVNLTGCPCGCRSVPPYIDDPDCARHKPLGPVVEWGTYDVTTLGTGCDHRDARCPAWRRRDAS